MAEAIAFDTHRFVKNLTASGFTEAQAEALAEEQVHLLDSNLATKSDIREIKSGIATAKAELEVKIERLRADVMRWGIAAFTAQIALLAALIWYV